MGVAHASARAATGRVNALQPIVAIVPALDEAAAIGSVVREAMALRDADGRPLLARVIVVDNGSLDDTAREAGAAAAEVVYEPRRGYGAACLAGIASATGAVTLVFIDGDASVDLNETPRLLEALKAGADLVIGVRRAGQRLGMTLPQRVGNTLATALIGVLWRERVSDLGPFRAVRSASLARLAMEDRSYGWTVEMQIKALQAGLRVTEVAVTVRPRIGRSKVSGTVRGVVGAAIGIFGMIFRLWYRERGRRVSRH